MSNLSKEAVTLTALEAKYFSLAEAEATAEDREMLDILEELIREYVEMLRPPKPLCPSCACGK